MKKRDYFLKSAGKSALLWIVLTVVFVCVDNAFGLSKAVGWFSAVAILLPIIIAFLWLNRLLDQYPASTTKKPQNKGGKKAGGTASSGKKAKRTSAAPKKTDPMERIDKMDGHEFEEFVANLLRQLGYERVKMTPTTGDQGVDITAVKGDKKYAIQCKRYAKKLGNTPVQEVNAGKTIYGCSIAVVLTNNYFTSGGKEAARALGVELWDRDVLQKMITYAEFKAGVI